MFETGMSALVLKICSEYAKALGLNFPPCVQQEINAIAQYVDLHTVKDLKVEQDGSVVTITCFTEGEQEKVFTVTLPEVNVDVLFNLIKGSSSVVVDKSEDGTHLVVRLDKSQEVQSIRIYNPQEPLTAEQLAILKANQENYILLYGSSIYKLQSAYVRDENTCVYSAADLTYDGTAGITNVIVNMSNGVWDIESTHLQNSIIYVELTPSTATQGALTSSQWDTLEKDKSNCIILNNEIYRLADNQNVSGLITYVHTGWDGTARKDKSISITVSTKTWTLVVAESGGGKLYQHDLTIRVNTDDTLKGVIIGKIINTDSATIATFTNTMLKKTMFDMRIYKGDPIRDRNNIYLTDRYVNDASYVNPSGSVSIYGYSAGTSTYPFSDNLEEIFNGTSFTVVDTVTEL